VLNDTEPSAVFPSSDLTSFRFGRIHSRSTNRAALYARVSTDAQQKEGTMNSQVTELKRQTEAAGYILVNVFPETACSQ
jgi:hypothetical protein